MAVDTLTLRSIQVLPPEVVERIAAGEVVERPVSVVRELMDNALDAGAGELRIDIRGGGLRLIRVADDGSGIPAEQVELALRHHATSKIREARDLLGIATLGFRGEALPSIAAVADLSLTTATGETPLAVRVEARAGENGERSYASRPRGTTVTARDLFATVPARLKFLGNARAESALISQMVRRYALAHPDVRFHVTLDGHLSLHTSGMGLDRTLGEVFGATVARAMVPIPTIQVAGVECGGSLTAGHVTRGSRGHLTLLVNGRCVQSRTILAALEEGYRPVLPRGRHPIGVIAITAPAGRVDVNVHPSKAEVRLQDEAAIALALKSAVRELLGRSMTAPPEERFALGPVQYELPRMIGEERAGWDIATGTLLRELHIVGQVHGSLIMGEHRSGLYLIDQHRAHERAIYELLCRRHAEGRAGQMLLEPLHIELTARQADALEHRLPELAQLGFQCEWFGGLSFLVRSVPVIPETADLAGVVEDLLLDVVAEDSDWQHRLLTSVACRTATRRGRPLTTEQCRELVALLAETEASAACPHGSPIILHFNDSFLERQFNW